MKKFMVRIITILMVAVMVVGSSGSAFAAEHEKTNITSLGNGENIITPKNTGVSLMNIDGQYGTDPIGQGESADFYLQMSSYIGFNRTVYLESSRLSFPASGETKGTVSVTLYNPNGSVRESWNLSATDSVKATYFLPSSGSWKVHVQNNTNVIVYVRGQWA